jgi:hypothetical protein
MAEMDEIRLDNLHGMTLWSASTKASKSPSTSMKNASFLRPGYLFCLFACLVLSPSTLQSQSSNCVPAPPGLISWWRAEGNANDSAGGNNGVLDGTVNFVAGRVGQAFSLNGINANVRVVATTSLNVGTGDGFTIEAWISPTSVAEQRPLIEWNNGAYGVNLWLQDTNSAGSGLAFNITDTGLQDHIVNTAAGVMTSGSYQHVAATYNKTNGLAALYINGVVAAQASVGTFTPRTIGDLYLGLRPAGQGAGFRFQGSMDEVSLYDRALSAAEVQAIFQAGGAGKCTGPSAPVIVAQPTNQTVAAGADATLALTALGTAPLSYQWLFHGTNLVFATNSVLVITNAQSSNAGPYYAIVTNLYGTATSVVATLTIGTQPACAPPPSGLVGWWKGDGNTLDQSGINNGTFAGDAAFGGGRVGQSFVFDGSGDGISLGNPAALQLQNFTIEAWVKRSSASVVSFNQSLGPGADIIAYGNGGYGFALVDDGRMFLGVVGVSAVFSSNSVTDTNWHHVAVTKSAGTVVFYVDGVGSVAPAYNPTFTFGSPVGIGARGDNLQNSLYGAIDELSVYDRALTAGDLQAIYNAGSAGKCPPPPPPCSPLPSNIVGWWRGDGSANDFAGTNNGSFLNGALYGAGKVGQAFSFTGGNNYVRIPAAPSLDVGKSNGMTIEGWINPSDLGQHPIVEWAPGGVYGALLWISVQSPGSVYADLVDSTGGLHLIQTGAGVITTNNFQHVAVTYDKPSGFARIFVNGNLVTESSLGSFTAGTSADLYIGYRPVTAPFGPVPFNGLIDEAALYSRALSPAEVQAIYQAGSAGKCTGPTPPVITAHPANRTVVVGDNVTFAVSATGTQPLSYRWYFNATNKLDATNASLTLNNVQFTNAGNYSVVVTNLYGSTTSSIAVLTVTATPSCTQPPAGLISWWRAEGNALDAGSANGGVLIGNAAYSPGRVGQAFVFDGTSDAVLVGNPTNLQLQDFTIETWVQRASISDSSSGFDGGEMFGYGVGGYAFGMLNDGTLFLSKVGISDVRSSTGVADTNVHHIAVTKSGTTVFFYIDGAAYAAPAYNTTFTFTTAAAVGARGDNYTGSFLGKVDELSIYNRALSAGEIQSIYSASMAGKCVVPIPPTIVTQPQNASVFAGANASFTVVAGGAVPLSYQWRFNGTNLSGATNATLSLNNVQFANAGNYSVLVTNVAGSVISSNALLTVNLPTPAIRLGSTNVMGGTRFTLPVTLAANGNENALGFSLTFSTQRLALTSVELGTGAAGATMLVNSSLVWTGRVGVALAYPPATTFNAGTQEVARLTFYALPQLTAVPASTIVFSDQPVLRELLNSQLQSITANYNNGTVTLVPTVFESDVAPRPSGNQAVPLVTGCKSPDLPRGWIRRPPARNFNVPIPRRGRLWATAS